MGIMDIFRKKGAEIKKEEQQAANAENQLDNDLKQVHKDINFAHVKLLHCQEILTAFMNKYDSHKDVHGTSTIHNNLRMMYAHISQLNSQLVFIIANIQREEILDSRVKSAIHANLLLANSLYHEINSVVNDVTLRTFDPKQPAVGLCIKQAANIKVISDNLRGFQDDLRRTLQQCDNAKHYLPQAKGMVGQNGVIDTIIRNIHDSDHAIANGIAKLLHIRQLDKELLASEERFHSDIARLLKMPGLKPQAVTLIQQFR